MLIYRISHVFRYAEISYFSSIFSLRTENQNIWLLVYPIGFEIKDTTDTDRSASYLDLRLQIDSGGLLRKKLYDKRDDSNFPIVNFPCICSNIPAAPAYGVYISQLIRDSRACGSYQCH